MKLHRVPRLRARAMSHPAPHGGTPSVSGTPVSVPRQPRFTPHAGVAGAPATPAVIAPDATAPLAAAKPAKAVPATAMKPVSSGPAQRANGVRQKTMRALIGDELRIPMLWCEFGSCINRFTDSGALGERDLRQRALETGWRYDALGRLACPSCVQHDAAFWPTCPPTVIIVSPDGLTRCLICGEIPGVT